MKTQLKFLVITMAALNFVNAAHQDQQSNGDLQQEAVRTATMCTKEAINLDEMLKERDAKNMQELSNNFYKMIGSLKKVGFFCLTKEAAKKTVNVTIELWHRVRQNVPGTILGGAGILVADSLSTEFFFESTPWALATGAIACYATSFLPKPKKIVSTTVSVNALSKEELECKLQELLSLSQQYHTQNMQQKSTDDSSDSDDDNDDCAHNDGRKLVEEILRQQADKKKKKGDGSDSDSEEK